MSIPLVLRLPVDVCRFRFFIIFFCGLVVCSSVKLAFFGAVSDYKELAKGVLFVLMCFLLNPVVFRAKTTSCLLFFAIIDFCFSLLQWTQFDGYAFQVLAGYLHPEHHIEGSLGLASVRALGVFADTAEHASAVFLVYLYFLANIRCQIQPLKSLLGLFICVIVIVMAQSKTGFIALISSLPLLYWFLLGFFSRFAMFLFLLINLALIFLVIASIDFQALEQYQRLFEYGLNVSSFSERQNIWAGVLRSFDEANFVLQFFGPGRGSLESHGLQSSVFDNDFVYLLNSYGVLGVIVIVPLYFYILYKLLRYKSRSPSVSWMLYGMIFSPIIGLATDFVSSLKIIALLGVMSSLALHDFNKHAKQ